MMHRVWPRTFLPASAIVLLLASSAPAGAQSTQANASLARGGWEVDVYGGGLRATELTAGTAHLPDPGQTFTTIVGGRGRYASSWYFGDGALQLNQISAGLGAAARIQPLDSVLGQTIGGPRDSGRFGARVRRAIGPHLAAEFAVDYGPGQLAMNDETLAGIEASRKSFASAIEGLLATGPFANRTVTSVATIDPGHTRQILTTGALNISLPANARIDPYLTLGGGWLSNVGARPSASIVGNYQFMIGNVIPVNETDTVKLHYQIDDHQFVTVVGGGVKYPMSPRWGVHMDLRAHITGASHIVTMIDAKPTTAAARPAGAIASFTTPSGQFSNDASMGKSTLSGPALSDFATVTTTGGTRHITYTAGVYIRF